MNNIKYIVVTLMPQGNIPSTSVSDIFENEVDAWFYIGQQVDELSKKDKNPIIVIDQFRKEVAILIRNNYGLNYPNPTPFMFNFSIHKTHVSKLTSNKN